MDKIAAVVLAGGRGSRMNSDVRKQYMTLMEKPILAFSLQAFDISPVDRIILVVGEGEEEYVRREIIERFHIKKVTDIVAGGKERYHSVYAGLKACPDCDYVLIHDGARPMIDQAIIGAAIEGAKTYEACVIAVPVKDTIKVADTQGYAVETPDRSTLWQVQTPQAFAYPLIRSAYDTVMADEKLQRGVTDDAMVVEKTTGHKIKMIEGSYRNIKVTTMEDLPIATAFLT